MKVLGVSGSPVRDSNTDRAVKAVLNATGLETEFIKLTDYTVAPCNACLGCVQTNRCVIEDDGIMLAEKAKSAAALIVGGFTPYSTLDSRTKAFIERLYPLRHQHGYMAGKPGGAVITSAVPPGCASLPPAADMGVNAIQFYMMEEGMNFLGAVKVAGNVPCIRCGHGDQCTMSGITMLYGADATVESVGVSSFEHQPEAIATAEELGRQIAGALASA
ncbi:MAG: NADPH-dependent FMN reductase [Armatimonadetes bacterium CG2_30_59_28]|nr:flavodoxin family protein [Armatimonadota bacterium]OIO96069.1 MAG: NADPH-dependent FMN reductase [Armatimonadetes bacterium CG2_30_59_28]PIU65651.1 MAG: flavodoxin family protein [Armatimonadetes bacterium CG07_land_8_20_14_0_80_59_28]PIX43519.1 MAG: flavodoxin family protein [Armatimonadetes bacterium CG_4_8_14_3_um_filter_58_9]